MNRITLLIAAFLAAAVHAQEISYGSYMERVLSGNIALSARKMDIEIAEAGVKGSKTYNDPTLAVTYTNSEDWDKKLGQGIEFELSRSFTFGVRRNRMDLAESERKQAVVLLKEHMRNFRADATIAYLEHLRARMLLQEAEEIHNELSSVASNDSLRFRSGDIAESDWLESRMAQGMARNSLLDARTMVTNSAVKLAYYMGNIKGAVELRGTGTLETDEEVAPIESYIEKALAQRPDIVAALARADIAGARQKFNRALRRPNLDVKIGATYNRARPDFTTLKAGIAMPIKFSNLNKGARIMDELLVRQANVEIEEARLMVEADVIQAYNEYRTASEQSRTFSSSMLDDMRSVVAGKKRAYELGEISFHDFLIVERSENEMRKEHIETLFNKAVAWVELQRATGFSMEFGTMPITE
ncbi:MAG: TolC family protein [Bacteroidaceae bacterium]|nr:TolC family protein [Bacteroidaceae bacterium]